MVRQNIYCGMTDTVVDAEVGIVQNWAVKVGDDWWEVSVDTKPEPNKLVIIKHDNEKLPQDKRTKIMGDVLGTTKKSEEAMDAWIKDFLDSHTGYDKEGFNCQHFVIQFVSWLTNGICQLGEEDEEDEEEEVELAEGAPENERRRRRGGRSRGGRSRGRRTNRVNQALQAGNMAMGMMNMFTR